MAKSNVSASREALERDIAFLAQIVQAMSVGTLGSMNLQRLASIADRYPMR